MELYKDEYSVFYDYETTNDEQKAETGAGSENDDDDDEVKIIETNTDVIEVPSDSDDDSDTHNMDDTFCDYDENGFTAIDRADFMPMQPVVNFRESKNILTLENNDGTYRCPLCPKEVVSKYNLKRHMMIHTGEKPHKCPTCHKGFREQSDLRKHKKVHIYGNKFFECKNCGRSYQSYKANRCYFCDGDEDEFSAPHAYEEDQSKRYNCFLCETTNLNVTDLKKHLIEEHPASGRSGASGVAPLSKGSNKINNHSNSSMYKDISRNVDTMEKIHKCNVCSKAFRSKQFLLLHTLTHTNNKIEPTI